MPPLRLLLAVALAAPACHASEPRASSPPADAAAARAAKPPAADAAAAVASATSPIPAASRQLVLGVATSWDAPRVELSRYQRSAAGEPWERVGEPFAAVTGAAGLGWGVGLHGAGAPDGVAGPVKVEGDRRSPAGVFAIGAAFGYDAKPPEGTAIDYLALDPSWRCVDDPSSRFYNRVLSARGIAKDWSSAERMRRDDELYRRGILIGHNAIGVGGGEGERPRGGAGSCVFFHVWRGADRPTVGCTAMPRPRLEALIAWLRPDARPVAVLLPAEPYRAVAARWGLPPRKK